jgi:serine/threonine protein kinase
MVDAGGAPIDRYVVLEHLSEGGMGAIYVGKKMGAGGFEMEVVLKQLLPEFTQQEEFIDLFLREAKLSATLDHANIVHTIDLVTAGGEYFIVMEYLPGGDLRTLLKKAKRRGMRFSPAAAIRICRETLNALAYAHVKRDFDGQPLKLIHRDVSPSNILLSYTGEVKLTDFGIAKASTHNSLFYKVKGKIGYMSPEQAKSESLDSRSDLYSLAVCMYEVLTGERLFVHAGLTTSADEIYSQPIPQMTRKVPGLPQDFDAIMQKALAIDPDARYQTAGEFQEALMRCAHRNGLLMSAPELATELRDACGPTDQWRSGEDDEEDFGSLAGKRAGTEVYDASDDEDDEGSGELDIRPSGPLSIHSIAARAKSPTKPPPRLPSKLPPPIPVRAKTEIEKFHGMELTSIINMIDVDQAGAKPLVDLSSAPPLMLDSGPQSLASGPHSLSSIDSATPFGAAASPGRAGLANTQHGSPPPPRPVPTLPMPLPQQRNAPPPRAIAMPAAPPIAAPSARPYPSAPPPNLRPPERYGTPAPTRSALRPWIVIVAILLVAGIVAIVVAMSGPNVAAGK